MVHLTIDGIAVEIEDGAYILDAAQKVGIKIPTLCHIKHTTPDASCRLCLVEIEGVPGLKTSCSFKVSEGMVVHTQTKEIRDERRDILDLMLSHHPLHCFSCQKNGSCEFQEYCYEYGLTETSYTGRMSERVKTDSSNPFFYYDPSMCILCRRCVNVCDKLVGIQAIGVEERGFESYVAPPLGKKWSDSDCVSCGNCMHSCPVGAILPRMKFDNRYRLIDVEKVRTTCPYCGVGCQMNLLVRNNQVVGVSPFDGKPNDRLLCVKGSFSYSFINHPDRLKTPLIKRNGVFEEASWEEALNLVVEKISAVKKEYGPDAIAGLSSARITNEENYVFQKLMRAAIGTNNVDHCARLCHASTVAGLATTLGSGAMTNSIEDVQDTDVFLISGSNTTETHPVIGMKIRQALRNGAKLIVAEPREIPLAQQADIYLPIKSGTNVAFFNGLMHIIIRDGLQDENYIQERTENYEKLKETVAKYTPEFVAEICDIDPDELVKAAHLYGKANVAAIYYSMGVTQHSTGTEGVMCTSNLALLCGNIGVKGGGVNPLRGQNNVQGACDMGALPTDYTGYQKVANEEAREKFSQAWGVTLPETPGRKATEMIHDILEDKIHLMYIVGENPLISDPDIAHTEKAFHHVDFMVVQDIFLTETAALADVVLPATTFAEKEGTFTNTERRVQLVRQAIPAVGNSRTDLDILNDISARLGLKNKAKTASEVMDEIASLTPSYGGMQHSRLEVEGLQWPCLSPEHPGTPILHTKSFSRGERALFRPAEYQPPQEVPDEEYPFIFTTGRILYHYHTRTMTGREKGLNKIAGESYVEINIADARALGIDQDDLVIVWSRRGEVEVLAKVTKHIRPGTLFMPFHFAEGAANLLTNDALDPIAKIPEFKACAAAIRKK